VSACTRRKGIWRAATSVVKSGDSVGAFYRLRTGGEAMTWREGGQPMSVPSMDSIM
jgi:hypothetical protein